MTVIQRQSTKSKKRCSASALQAIINESFWSGNLPVKKWRTAIRDPLLRYKAIIRTSFSYMPSSLLVAEIGQKKFIEQWPGIRQLFPPDDGRVLLFDGIWGVLTTGDSQYPVSGKIAKLSKGRRALLAEIIKDPGLSIYALQKLLGRPYSRVFKDVKLLAENHLINIDKGMKNGRRVSSLFSTESINTRLFKASQNIV